MQLVPWPPKLEKNQHTTSPVLSRGDVASPHCLTLISFCMCSRPCLIPWRFKPQAQHPARWLGPAARRHLSQVQAQPPNTRPTTAMNPGLGIAVHPQSLSARAHYSEQMKILTFQYSSNWPKWSLSQNALVINFPNVLTRPLPCCPPTTHPALSLLTLAQKHNPMIWPEKVNDVQASIQIGLRWEARGKCRENILGPNDQCAPLGGDCGKRWSESSVLSYSASEGPGPTRPPTVCPGNWPPQHHRNDQKAENVSCCSGFTWRRAGMYLGTLGTYI